MILTEGKGEGKIQRSLDSSFSWLGEGDRRMNVG